MIQVVHDPVPVASGIVCPQPLAASADRALTALAELAPDRPALRAKPGRYYLTERAAITGNWHGGAVSPGGSCHLLPAADGRLAVNLARLDDWELLPAWLESDDVEGWAGVARSVAGRSTADLVARARLLGLAVADAGPPRAEPVPWFSVIATGETAPPGEAPLVVDLSSLWAGPLCGRLLADAGAEVVKVESSARPDGARFGPLEFHERQNASKSLLTLDLRTEAGVAELTALLRRADIVIEASRPRALRQMGIDAEALLRERPGLVWVSITGYGREEPEGQWIAYGDDAAVAAGLSWVLHAATGEWMIAGDAIADPLTGLHAAWAAWCAYRRGGGQLLSIALCDVVTHALQASGPLNAESIQRCGARWISC